MGTTLKVVYTPLHGAGNLLVRRLLKEIGFENVFVVKEQEEPDGTFPTVDYPNPEDPKAFKMALDLARKVDADIVLATDPDSDRLGIYAKDVKTGEYKGFNGNMSALLILEYILSQRKEKNILPKDGAIIKSIVSSTMTEAIAENYQIHVDAVLTGFKNMGAKIKGAGTSTIQIVGVTKLNGCFHEVIPDRIEAGTYIITGALIGNPLKINGLILFHK